VRTAAGVNVSRLGKVVAIVLVAASWAAPPVAQSVPAAPKRPSPSDYPPPLGTREGPPPPALTFRRVSEIPLPGPLLADATRLRDGTLRLPVNGGWAIVTLEPSVAVAITETDPAESLDAERLQPPWVVSPDGRSRYTTLPEGAVLAERRRSKGWKKTWRLRVAASTPAPPLLAGERLLFGALDNQVHAVRSANGHRLWAADVGARVSNPLSLWRRELETGARTGEATPVELVLLVPDDGASLIALDSFDGNRVATLELSGDDSRFLPPALPTADGRIVVAVQRYAESAAALAVFELGPPDEPPPGDGVAYNDPERPEGDEPD